MNLLLSLIALVSGPLLYSACKDRRSIRSALDGLLFVTIAGIVIVHIVPDVVEAAGFTALAFLAAGLLVAFVVERQPSLGGGKRYSWIVFLGALGLVIHATMDGIALLPGDHLHAAVAHDDQPDEAWLAGLLGNHLAVGVILHRIPVGMVIWWTLRPRLGSTVAIAALAIIVVATSAAYLLGEPVIAMMEARSFALFQAFVAGTLLHVIVLSSAEGNQHGSEGSQPHANIGERLGIILGIALVFLVPHGH